MMQFSLRDATLALFVLLNFAGSVSAEFIVDFTQFGTAEWDSAVDVAFDVDGAMFIGGNTGGTIGDQAFGGADVFVQRRANDGSVVWTRQFGTTAGDGLTAVASDGLGNVYAGGATFGELGATAFGSSDAFVSKLDGAGDILWTSQFGSEGIEGIWDISADQQQNVFATGDVKEDVDTHAFLSKHDANGNLLWMKPFGTSSADLGRAVDVDNNGNVFVTGYTWGQLGAEQFGSADLFVSKFDSEGEELWTMQTGTRNADFAFDITIDDDGNALIAGETGGSLDGSRHGDGDMFAMKVTSEGEVEWTTQIGTSAYDDATGIATDGAGNIMVTGGTSGVLFGENHGGSDIAVIQLDGNGQFVAGAQYGTSLGEVVHWHASYSGDEFFFTGVAIEALGGSAFGGQDAFFARVKILPEPRSFLLLGAAFLGVVVRNRRRAAAQGR